MESEELQLVPAEPTERRSGKKKIVELNPKQRERFDKCWNVWTNKNGKGQAEITWAKYDFDDKMTETIHSGILEWNRTKGTKHMTKDQKRFIPHFSTWINNKGWVFEESRDGEYSKPSSARKCPCGQLAKIKLEDKDVCIRCYDDKMHPNFKREVYENLCKRGLGKGKDESPSDYLKRMREQGMKALRKFNAK